MNIKLFSSLMVGVLLYALPVSATEMLLGKTALELKQGKVQAELWGDVLSNGYANNLLLLIKNTNGKVLGAYNPDVKGGYNCLLQAVQVQPVVKKDKAKQADVPKTQKLSQQLLLGIGQGNWARVSEYRVLDFSNLKSVKAIFSASDNLGIVKNAYVEAGKLQITLNDGNKRQIELNDISLQSKYLEYGGMFSITAKDLDNDGQEELLTTQQLRMHDKVLADVGAVWQLQAGAEPKWAQRALTIMTSPTTAKSGVINDGVHLDIGSILPRKMVVPGGEATYPVFASKDLVLQAKINDVLQKESIAYLDAFYSGQADMAFQIIRTDEKMLTLQLISGKTQFVRHNIHFNPVTGEQIYLQDILDTKQAVLPELLNVLRTHKEIDFRQGLPDEWYLVDKNIYFVKYIDGKEVTSGFAIGNLHKYLVDKKWLE